MASTTGSSVAGGQRRAVLSLPSACLPLLSNGSRDEARRLLSGTEWGQSPWCLSFPCGWISLCGLRASVPLPHQHQHPLWERGAGLRGPLAPSVQKPPGILAGSRAEGEEGRGEHWLDLTPLTYEQAGQGCEGAPAFPRVPVSSTWGGLHGLGGPVTTDGRKMPTA